MWKTSSEHEQKRYNIISVFHIEITVKNIKVIDEIWLFMNNLQFVEFLQVQQEDGL